MSEKVHINTEHTATPWIWNDQDQLVSSVAKDHDGKLALIIETDSGFYPPHNNDRAFIARACNTHAGLVSALQEIARAGDNHSSAIAKAALQAAELD